jgi:hypothetical protein
MPGVGRDGLNFQPVVLEICLCIVQDLAGGLYFSERRVRIARYDGRVVNEIHKTARMFGQDELLLCALNGGCKVVVICLLELLARLSDVSGAL